MDLATMFVILVFNNGTAEHFVQTERTMGACMSKLGGKTLSRRQASAETDYAAYRLCLPISARVFNRASPPRGEERKDGCGRGDLKSSTTARPGTLYLRWTGEIGAEFYKSIAFEFEKTKKRVRNVLLEISSCGGDRETMERTIRLLRYLKRSHTFETVVDRGEICASACVPIFLQGQRRWGALTSSWLFHEVSRWDDRRRTEESVNRTVTARLLEDYFPQAGVPEAWLNRLRMMIQHSDYWQTGENLWEDKSGIITDPLDNHVPRGTEQQRF